MAARITRTLSRSNGLLTLMERFYPKNDLRPSRNRWLLLGIFTLAVWIWLVYALATGSPRWENHLLTVFVVSSLAAVSVAQSFWPILSFDKTAIYHHRPLWFAQKCLIASLDNIEVAESNLYLTHKSGSVTAIELSRLSPENIQQITNIVSKTTNA